jgi:hypothetical protein
MGHVQVLEAPFVITAHLYSQVNQRLHHIIASRVLIPTAILLIARIEKYLLTSSHKAGISSRERVVLWSKSAHSSL